MTKTSARLLAAAALFLCAAARAEDGVVVGQDFYRQEIGAWEFGLDVGMAYPTQKHTVTHVIDNQRAYDLLVAESVGDEVAEGWVAPPLPGYSSVTMTLRQTGDIGIHLYRRFASWLQWGVEGGWALERSTHIDDPGLYKPNNFLTIRYDASMIHATFPAKVGPSSGLVRPFAMLGPGFYDLQERSTIGFNDPDDPQLKGLPIVLRDGLHFGAVGGAGVEVAAGPRGLVGLEVQYHKVFAGRTRADFLLPRLRCSVAF